MEYPLSSAIRARVPLVLSGLVVALFGCSNPGEDVRVTLCRDLVSGMLKGSSAPLWGETRLEPRRLDRLAIHLSFEASDAEGAPVKPMRASCFFRYDAVEETAMTLADPLSAFSTSPSGMSLNGREITNPLLAEAVKGAMLKQGREFLERARRGLEEAANQAHERLSGSGAGD